MLRLIALAMIMVSGSIFSLSFAQNFGAPSSAQPAAKSPVMSNEQFKSAVDKLSKKTKSNVSQQANEQLSTKPTSPGSTPSSLSSQPASPPTTFDGTVPAQPAPNYPTNPPPQTNTAVKPPTPATNEIYTGFGSTPPAPKKDASGNSKGQSNWNMGY